MERNRFYKGYAGGKLCKEWLEAEGKGISAKRAGNKKSDMKK